MAIVIEPPPSAPRARPETFQLSISRDGPNDLMNVDAEGNVFSAEIRLSLAELTQRREGLLQSWQNEIGMGNAATPWQSSCTQSEANAARQMAQCADAGNAAFRQLVDAMGEPIRTRFIEVLHQFVSGEGTSLVFMANSAFPWRMLYVPPDDPTRIVSEDDPPESFAARNFLGYAGVVDQIPRILDLSRQGPGNRVPIGVYEGFRNRRDGGISAIAEVFASNPLLTPEFVTTEKELAKSLLADQSQAIYLFCHGVFQGGGGGQVAQQLRLRENFAVTGAWLESKLYGKLKSDKFSTPPVVLVNACQGGVFGEGDGYAVTETFRRLGAQTTVAPLVNIPVCFAGDFGARLMGLLVEGRFVGDALRDVTRVFADEQNNILGLSYSSINGRNRQIQISPATEATS